jgi:hypothetical protein
VIDGVASSRIPCLDSLHSKLFSLNYIKTGHRGQVGESCYHADVSTIEAASIIALDSARH